MIGSVPSQLPLVGGSSRWRHSYIGALHSDSVSFSEGTPLSLVLSVLLIAAALLAFSLHPDPQLAERALSAVTSLAAFAAAFSSLRAARARGILLDPLLGVGSLYSALGFALASAGWALDAAGLDRLVAGSLSLSKLLWYSSGILLILALWEIAASARAAAGGLRESEKLVSTAVPAAYAVSLMAVTLAHGATIVQLAEIAGSAVFLGISLSALLPIRGKRYSWGLTLLTAGSAVFLSAVALVPLAGAAVPPPLPNALYALAFVFAAAGFSVYRKESIILR